ncbi:MAG: hypothetical protein KAS32_31270 [Candidatus Peribacteraceae bacterium]|nr:hypothetical protein [Candidatus Peribacteraceae bacterium]
MNRKQIKRVQGNLRKIASQIHRNEILKMNKVMAIGVNKKGEDQKMVHHPCNSCKKLFRPYQVEIDHVDEVGKFIIEGKKTKTKYGDCRVINWQEWMDRVFCDLDNFQVLCVECHQKKTIGFNKDMRFGGHLL